MHTLDTLGSRRVLVLGDLILDRYTFAGARRVSPEAPVVVFDAQREEMTLGGAASVALLLGALEARVTLAGVRGADADGALITNLLDRASINCELILVDDGRPTTVKHRIVGSLAGKSRQQVARPLIFRSVTVSIHHRGDRAIITTPAVQLAIARRWSRG